MIFLNEKSIRLNIKKFGFNSIDSATVILFNKNLEKFNEYSIKQALKNNKKINKQNGGSGSVGHTVLPSEYFGINTKNYFTNAESTNMNITNSMIRPVIQTQDLSGSIKGGKSKYNTYGGSGAHGHTVLPSEYFGNNSGSYFEHLEPPTNGTNMQVTNSMIRPVIKTYDLTGVIHGGAINNKFTISKNAFKNSLNEALLKFQSPQNAVKLSPDVSQKLQNKFELLMTEILNKANKANKKEPQLQLYHIKEVMQQKKYEFLKN